jgi:hypothetical protein
VDEAFE